LCCAGWHFSTPELTATIFSRFRYMQCNDLNCFCVYYKLYKCLHIEAFSDLFNLRSEVHRYPTRSSKDSTCGFAPKTKYGYATFYFKTTTFWNNLPMYLYIKEAPSLKLFKQQLKLHLVNSQKERLDVP
jgi:hypothetical protein